MSLRWKVAGILFAILLLYVALAYAIASRVVFSSFEALERKEAEENLQRCVSAIWREVQQIQAFAYDWASWDDTYRFVETRDPAYVETNLADASFVRNSLGYIGFVDVKNQTVWSRAVDTAAQADLEVPELSREIWPQDHPLLVSGNSPEGASGILLTASGPLLAASRPILTSMNEGPIRGTLIMGAFLNERLVETLCKQVGVQFRLFPLSVPDAMPRDMQEIVIELKNATNAVFRPLGMKSINAYGMLRDLNAKPALLVEAVTPPQHHARRNAGAARRLGGQHRGRSGLASGHARDAPADSGGPHRFADGARRVDRQAQRLVRSVGVDAHR